MEKTLVILKPNAIQRELVGEIINRFERKGLRLCGIKMMQLSDEILAEHYVHLVEKPFYKAIKDSMQATPVVVCCWEGVQAVEVVRAMTGATNARTAAVGTLRGDFGMSVQKNLIHTSDSPENAKVEVARFFAPHEIFDYHQSNLNFLYADDEI